MGIALLASYCLYQTALPGAAEYALVSGSEGTGGEGPLLVLEPVFAFRLDANKCAGGRMLLESQRDGIDDRWCLTVEEACMIHFVMKAGSKDLCSCLWHSVFLPLQSAHGRGKTDSPAAFWISLALVSRLWTPLQCGRRVIPSDSGHR